MTGYTILKTENLPDSLKGKPRWMICVVFTAGLLIMTLSAVSAGFFVGYTYSYVEHRTSFRAAGNVSHTQDLQIFSVPLGEAPETKEQNTINGALASSYLVQKFLKIGHTLWDDDHVYSPEQNHGNHLDKLERET